MNQFITLLSVSSLITSVCFIPQLRADDTWRSDQSYLIGETVTLNEERFIATLWNRGNSPQEAISHWDGWVSVNETIEQFEWEQDYKSGDLVYVNGERYLAKWGNRNEQPESSWYWRRLGSDDFIDVSGALSVEAKDPKSALAILGEDRNRNSIRDSYEANVFALYSNTEQQRLAMNVSYVYRALHQLELDESMNLLEEEATELFQVLAAWNNCIELLHRSFPNAETPIDLHMDTIYRALFYRFGQNEAYLDLNGSEEWIWSEQERDYCQYYELMTK